MRSILFIFLLMFNVCALADILDGEEDTGGSYNNVYKIAFKGAGVLYPHCTATIIDNFTVITAAHCTDQIRGIKKLKLLIDNRFYGVADIKIPKEYFSLSKSFYEVQDRLNKDPNNRALYDEYQSKHLAVTRFDLALIKLKRRVSRAFVKTKLNFKSQLVGSSVTAVGFGYLSFEETSEGIIYNNPVNPFFRHEVISSTNTHIEIHNPKTGGQITSAGDSGGPLLTPDGEQVGVLRGIRYTENDITSIYVPLGLHKVFIENNS